MKKLITYIIPILLLLIVSCAKTPKERVLTMKDVFPTQKNTDSTVVFDLETIVEVDSICEKVKDKNQFIRKGEKYFPVILDLSIYCRRISFCPKGRNIILVEVNFKQDSTYFSNRKLLEVNNFGKLLKKQFLNRGENPEYADSPDKSIVLLNYFNLTKKSAERISKALDTISVSYFNFIKGFQKRNIDSLKKIYPLQILLERDSWGLEIFKLPKLPPPPAPIEIIE